MFLQGIRLIPTGGSPGVQAGQTTLLSTMINIGRIGQCPTANPFHPAHTKQPPPDLKKTGGARRDRTDDLLNANQALSQLSYGPSQFASRAVPFRP